MRIAAFALLPLLVGWGGCILSVDAAYDCRSGERDVFAIVRHNKDFFGPEEEVRRDRFETIDRDGYTFGYVGDPEPGGGAIVGPASAFHNVTREEVRRQLQAYGNFDKYHDYNVTEAWKGRASDELFGRLCEVLHEEWVTPSEGSSQSVGCADGGSYHYVFSTSRGIVEKDGGCLAEQTQAEYESQRRIDEAFWAVVQDARSDAGVRT